ncbi:MAG TPA: four helix bundle protein [Opitutaceae bacterium]
MKLQPPTSKLQRKSKRSERARKSDTGEYQEPREDSCRVEDPDGVDSRHPFDLEERTAVFGENIIRFLKKVPLGPRNDRLIDQLVGCGTSVGANYCEASEGVSKKDFRNIIGRCRKEAKESKFFLRMIAASEPDLAQEARTLFREAKELHLIFCSIYRNSA